MRYLALLALLLPGLLSGQVSASLEKFTASLAALKDASSSHAVQRDRIANDIMALSEQPHRPSRSAAARLADGLVGTLSGKQLTDLQLSELATGIVAVLHSAGGGTSKFKQSLFQVENALSSAGVNTPAARRVVAELEVVGKQVRGPEDLPARALE